MRLLYNKLMHLVFDIGATKIRLAVSANGQNLSDPVIIPTPQDFNEGIKVIVETAQKLVKGQQIEKVAGGIAGLLNKEKTVLSRAVNLPNWENKPLKQNLEQTFNAPVFLENDSDLACLGEAWRGSGQGQTIVAYLTISTGVGGSRVVKGKVDDNISGFEPGHQIIDLSSLTSLEDTISGTALAKKYEKKSEDIDDPKVWDEVAKNLAVGIYNTTLYWSPNVVILGGSVMKSLDLEKIKSYLKEINKILPDLPEIKKASLRDLSALYGALCLLP